MDQPDLSSSRCPVLPHPRRGAAAAIETAALKAMFGSRKLRDGPGAYTMAGFHDMGFAAFGEVRGRLFRTAPVLLPTDRPRDAAGG